MYMGKKFAVDLPHEILTIIFLSLTTMKSLLICKSVCKSWLSIISNRHFIQTHLQRVIIASGINPRLLIIENPTELRTLSGGITSYNDFDRLVMPSLFKFTRVVCCSYNGIICLSHVRGHVVYLWNPSVRQCKKIRTPTRGTCMFRIGFGYDSISNDFKVVKIVQANKSDVLPRVHVYSTNANSWREFQEPILKDLRGYEETVIVVNGVLYFCNGEELITFDLHKEFFGLVPLPSFKQTKCSDIMDFEGSVAILFISGPDIFYLWTLDDVSGQMSWTKKCSITDPEMDIWLYCYLGAGQFYGSDTISRNYFLYDYAKKETKFYELGEYSVLAALKYTQTLVSLDGFERVESDAN